MRNRLVNPHPVAGSNISPEWCAARSKDKLHDRIAINPRRHCLPKLHVLEPCLLACNGIQLLARQIVQVEQEEVVFKTRAEIRDLRSSLRLLFREQGEILGTQTIDDIRLARLKTHYLRVF